MLFQAQRCPPPAVKVPHLSDRQRARVIPAEDSIYSYRFGKTFSDDGMRIHCTSAIESRALENKSAYAKS